jgi:hypothetical protein
VKELWQKFLDYLNHPAHVRPLCLYRVFLGLLVFGETLTWLPHTEELFSNQGLHLGVMDAYAPDPSTASLLCLVLLASALLISLGLLTKPALVTSLVVLGFLVSIDQLGCGYIRNSISLVVLFLLVFMPCNRFYSVDAWLLSRWKPNREAAEETMPGLMFRLLQILFLQMYFFSGLHKLLEESWRNGSALADAWSGLFSTDLGLWLAGWIPLIGYKLMSLGTIGFELLAPWGLNSRRWLGWFVLAGMALHVGIQLTLHVGILGYHFMLAIIFLFAIPGGLVYPKHFLKKPAEVGA